MTNRINLITVCGHINHGKSTLIQNLIQTNIVKNETDGITQDVKAYELENTDLVLLDTPGHESFNYLKELVLSFTHIAVLVIDRVAGPNKETHECIKVIRKYNIPTIVYLSNSDRESSLWTIGDNPVEYFSGTELDSNIYDVLFTDGSKNDSSNLIPLIQETVPLIEYKEDYSIIVINTLIDKRFSLVWVLVSELSIENLLSQKVFYHNDLSNEITLEKVYQVGNLYYAKVASSTNRIVLGKYGTNKNKTTITENRGNSSTINIVDRKIKFGFKASTLGELLTIEQIVRTWDLLYYRIDVMWTSIGPSVQSDILHLEINDINIGFNCKKILDKKNDYFISSINDLNLVYNEIKQTLFTPIGKIIKVFVSDNETCIIGVELLNDVNNWSNLICGQSNIQILSVQLDNKEISVGKKNTKIAMKVSVLNNQTMDLSVNKLIFKDNYTTIFN